MTLEVGQTGTMNWQDGTSSRVKVVGKETYSRMPTDYWFEYEQGETNRQLVHPDLAEEHIKASILLPEGLIHYIFTPDKPARDENSFEARLEDYIENNFNETERRSAVNLFKQLERTAGREYIENEYFNKK